MSCIVIDADYARAHDKPQRIETPKIVSVKYAFGYLEIQCTGTPAVPGGQIHRVRLDILEEVRI